MASASTSSTPYSIGNNFSHYDVFINHRGPDVKKGLASHLYHRLVTHGLRVFLDVEELQGGDNLTPQIEGAIKTASVHIAIFSSRYAESHWCLNELLLMLESGSTIIPVFYDVNPSELRWTRGGDGVYAQALRILEKKRTFDSQPRYDSHTIEKWRNALSVVAEISGFELNACNRDEGQLTDKIVQQVLKKVSKTPLHVAKYPTGLDEKVKDVENTMILQRQSEKARVVGIVGVGGVGKTTLAKEFFNSHKSNYDRSCFVSDVRENSAKLSSLQNILLRDLADLAQSDVQINSADEGNEKLKRHLTSAHQALVVLDDVDHIDQLDALFSPLKHSIHSGSLILVTSRNKDLLTSSGIEESFIYKQTGLNRHHSLELFCSHAFDRPYPVIGFEGLVEKFLDSCDGLPLSLKVIGALLCGKDLKYWEAQLHKISKILPSDIMRRLKISYDSLDEEEKQIFLDIACFFIGEDRDTAIRIWDGSRWEGWLGLRNLENRCLVEVDYENCIRMHDHLRDLGRDIAKKETPHRLWNWDIPFNSLLDQLPVRGISMVLANSPEQSYENLAELAGSRLSNSIIRLQLLRADGYCVERIFSVGLLPQLIYLRWENCPYSCLPLSITIKSLRVLYIKGGNLETLWQHESQAPLQLRELDIDANLLEVPKSIGMLKYLQKFVLCWKTDIDGAPVDLKTLPDEFFDIPSLQHLELKNCGKIISLPDAVGNWTNLESIDLGRCSHLQMLPDSIGKWTNLQRIDLHGCSTLPMLPDSVGKWTNLQRINLADCSALRMLPDSVGNWTKLQSIDCLHLQMLPDSVGNWKNLQHIDCSSLQTLPDSVGNWTNLQSIDCSCLQMLPYSVGNWTKLKRINMEWFSKLKTLPDSVGNWSNLQSIELICCSNLQMVPDSVGNWTNLQNIDLGGCSSLQVLPDSVGNWTNLKFSISLYMCPLKILPDSVGNWTNIQRINLDSCSNLKMLPDSVGNWTNLQRISLSRCSNLEMLPDSIGNWINLQSIDLHECFNLHMLPGSVGNWRDLQRVDLRGCSSLHWDGQVLKLLHQRLKSELLI